MALKATCPTSPDHKRFITQATVIEEWVVDERGNWMETLQAIETHKSPDERNTWTCKECGAWATIERVPR